MNRKISFALLIVLLVSGVFTIGVDAQVPLCSAAFTYDTTHMTMDLTSDCTTETTVYIPDGYTLNGHGFTMTGVDPVGSNFVGAVIKNAGSVAHATNVVVTVSNLADVCDGGDNRLAGVWLQDASGSVTGVTVVNLRQGINSGCQEGNGIQIRSAPFDHTHPAMKFVTISDNTVTGYQKTGILCNGDLNCQISNNTVTGLGKIFHIAQNGIQCGFGCTGSIFSNKISGNYYVPKDTQSAGILFYDVQASTVSHRGNKYANNEKNVLLNENSAIK